MDPLTLTLLAMTAMTTTTTATGVPSGATTAPPVLVVPLDMAPASFDDQYRGCGRAMAAELPALNRSELQLGAHFAEAWALATAQWRLRPSPGSPRSPGSPLSPAQAIALMAYTAPVPLHREFNEAVRAAGRSRRQYRDHFHFKTLHFLLTQAVVALRDAQDPRCHRALRGAARGLGALRPLRVGVAAQRELLGLRHGRGLPGADVPRRRHPRLLLLPARGGGADPALRDLRGHRCHPGWGQGADPAALHRDLQQLQLRVAARAALWGRTLRVRHGLERPQVPSPPRGAPRGHHSPGSGHRNLLSCKATKATKINVVTMTTKATNVTKDTKVNMVTMTTKATNVTKDTKATKITKDIRDTRMS